MSGLGPTFTRWALQGGIRLEMALSRLSEFRIKPGAHEIVYLDNRDERKRSCDRTPIVMLHGFGGDRFNWIRYARYLTDRHRVVIPDLPGFGDSSRIRQEIYSTENQTTWLAEFLDAVGIEKLHLAGNSMGGHIATLFAARFPRRVETLILHAPAGTEGAGPPWDISERDRGQHPLKVFAPEDFDALMRWVFVKPPMMVGPIRRHFAAQAIANRPFLLKVFDDIMHRDAGNPLVEPLLPAISAPTLLIWGQHDRLLDCTEAAVYRRLMPNAKVFVLPDCGHLPMAELPRKTARMTSDFLETAPADPRSVPLAVKVAGSR